MHENIRIKAAFLVVAADQVYKNTGLRIRNGRVTEIVPNEMEDETEEVVDCTKDIVCPSFSDMHTHLYSTLLKNVALPKVSLVENLRTFWWPRLENRQTIGTIQDAVNQSGAVYTLASSILSNSTSARTVPKNTPSNISSSIV